MDTESLPTPRAPRYSAIIPVFNSAGILDATIDRVVSFFRERGLDYELLLINDGSRDRSWEVASRRAGENPRLTAIDLCQNYGQHTALYCGLQLCTGSYAVTLDDDLQNPPEEILRLIEEASHGHDLVFGRFRRKQHPGYRVLGSWGVRLLNRAFYGCPRHLVLSNFRIIRRDVIDRISAYRTPVPYITGLCLMFSSNPGNVLVDHHPRPAGRSNYSPARILRLVARILLCRPAGWLAGRKSGSFQPYRIRREVNAGSFSVADQPTDSR
jgi:glycosyltransferase involved in cell wall biosynthesis